MSDAYISRRFSEIDTIVINPIDNTRSVMYVSSDTFTMPSNVLNNEIEVSLVGAGNSNTGFGDKKTETLQLQPGESVKVYVGREGKNTNTGGITSFGTYLASNGQAYIPNNIDNNEVDSGDGYAIITYKLKGDSSDE